MRYEPKLGSVPKSLACDLLQMKHNVRVMSLVITAYHEGQFQQLTSRQLIAMARSGKFNREVPKIPMTYREPLHAIIRLLWQTCNHNKPLGGCYCQWQFWTAKTNACFNTNSRQGAMFCEFALANGADIGVHISFPYLITSPTPLSL